MKGLQVLTKEQIGELYGSPVPKFTALEWPKLWNFTENDPPHYHTLSTYFDTCKVPAILMAVKLIDEGKVNKTYQ